MGIGLEAHQAYLGMEEEHLWKILVTVSQNKAKIYRTYHLGKGKAEEMRFQVDYVAAWDSHALVPQQHMKM